MKIAVPAQLYTSKRKYSTSIIINGISGIIAYSDPERDEMLVVGQNCRMKLLKRGWFLADFAVVDIEHSPPLWQHKLTLYKSDGDKLTEALDAWGT